MNIYIEKRTNFKKDGQEKRQKILVFQEEIKIAVLKYLAHFHQQLKACSKAKDKTPSISRETGHTNGQWPAHV